MKSQEKQMTVWGVLKAAAPWVGIIISIIVAYYNHTLNEKLINLQSYSEPINYKIELSETQFTPKLEINENDTIVISNIEFTAKAYSGGIKKLFSIIYYDGKTYTMHETNLSDRITRETAKGYEYIYRIGLSHLQATSMQITNTKQTTYTTHFYVLVEGYQRDQTLNLVVFDFTVDENGEICGNNKVTTYSPEHLLLLNSGERGEVPDKDFRFFADYKKLLEELAEIESLTKLEN